MKNVSVLGGGWLGLPLSEFLSAKGFSVQVSTRSVDRLKTLEEHGLRVYQIDLAKKQFGELEFYNSEILIVNIPFKDVQAYSGLIEVIEQSSITHVIFVSSTSVYGNKEGLISEDDSDYLVPCSLLEIEQLFITNKNFTTTVVRFGGLIGHSRNPALFFKSGKLVQNPDSKVNMIHRDDCINILQLIIEKGMWGKIYNGCADTHPTKRAFYTHAAKLTNVPVPLFSEANDGLYKTVSNRKVKEELSYDFIHPNLLNLTL